MSKRVPILVGFLLVTLLFTLVLGTSSAQEYGFNWSATFYNTTTLSGTGVPVTGINGINFNWGTGVPIVNGVAVPGIPADNFSAAFTSSQTFQGGVYTFSATSDDGIRVIIDGQVLLDRFVGRVETTDTFTYTMTAGVHSLRVEYFEGVDKAIVRLQWVYSGVAPTVGPSPTPGPTNTPAPTSLPSIPGGATSAVVIRASVLNIRAAPSMYAPRLGSVLRGQEYQVIGRDESARWFLLQLSGFQGWALGYYLYIRSNEFNAPVISDYVLQDNPADVSGVVATSYGTLRLRAAPTTASAQIGRIVWGGVMAVTGKTRDGIWWQVVWKGTTGWAYSPYLRITEGSLNDVPVIQ
jgi:uncharacterized protein YraI